MSHLGKSLADSAFYATSKMGAGGAMAVLALTLPALLPVGNYAKFSLAIGVAGAIAGLGVGWIRQATYRFGLTQASWDAFGHNYVALSAGASSALSFAVGFWWRDIGFAASAAVATLTGCVAWALVKQAILGAELRAREITHLELIRGALTLLFVLGATYATGSLYVAILALAGPYLVYAFARSSPVRSASKVPSARVVFRYGAPWSVWALAAGLIVYVDRAIVAREFGGSVADSYASSADSIVRVLGFALAPIAAAFGPRIMRMWNDGYFKDARRLIIKGWFTSVALGVTAILAISGVGVWGGGYAKLGLPTSVVVLQLMGAVLWQMSSLAHLPLMLKGRSGTATGLAIAALAVTIVAEIALAQAWGLIGPPLGLVLSGGLYLASAEFLGRILKERSGHWQPQYS